MIPAFIADQENKKRRGEHTHENRVGVGCPAYGSHYDDIDDDDDDAFDDDDIVLETKGGSPPPPNPMAEARAQAMLEELRARLEQEKEARRREQEKLDYEEKVRKAAPKQSQAFDYAMGFDEEQIKGRGIDQALAEKYGLGDLFTSAVERARMGIAEDDLNPMASYALQTMFGDALDTARGSYRGDLRRMLGDLSPEGFEYDRFQDTADDDILEAILGSRRQDALAAIEQAKARGQLNDTGYTRALEKLEEQAQGGMADLQDIGLGILSGYRSDLSGLRESELDRIGLVNFVDPYNFDTYRTRLENRYNDLNNRLRGDLYRATEGQTFFDPSSIISKSGALQGFYNPSAGPAAGDAGPLVGGGGGSLADAGGNPLMQAFKDQNKKRSSSNFNLGGNGVF